jgi:hypothetical protein
MVYAAILPDLGARKIGFELALFFRGLKTANFSYSFYIKELTIILTLQKLALFCIKTG